MANTNSPLAQKVKRKQMIILGGVALVIMVFAIASAYMVDGKKPEVKPTGTVTRNLIGATTDTADREKWRERSAEDIERLRRQMADQQKANADLQKVIAEINERQKTETEKPATARGGPVVPPPSGALPVQDGQQILPGAPVPMASSGRGSVLGGPGMVMPDGSMMNVQPSRNSPAVQTIKFDKPPEVKADAVAGQKVAHGASGRPYRIGPNGERMYLEDGYGDGSSINKTYVPAGTFARVLILGGVDAPTGGQAQSNPHPILLRVMGDAHLPNGGRVDIRDCVLTADAVGDLSSERVQIRSQRMSCRVGENMIADIAVRGHVNGEDGKAGMRGRLVTKTGQVLANALLTGTLSALGTAIQGNNQEQIQTGLGTVTQTTDMARYAVGGGLTKAFDRMADYYIKLADKLFPVLEVDSMRVGDIVFTQGFTIEAK